MTPNEERKLILEIYNADELVKNAISCDVDGRDVKDLARIAKERAYANDKVLNCVFEKYERVLAFYKSHFLIVQGEDKCEESELHSIVDQIPAIKKDCSDLKAFTIKVKKMMAIDEANYNGGFSYIEGESDL